MSEQSNCRSCGAEIIWCVTESGKRMPVDAQTSVDGNIILELKPGNAPPTALVRTADQLTGHTLRHKSHFATCKQADKWRRK
jgi:hypothetical protein